MPVVTRSMARSAATSSTKTVEAKPFLVPKLGGSKKGKRKIEETSSTFAKQCLRPAVTKKARLPNSQSGASNAKSSSGNNLEQGVIDEYEKGEFVTPRRNLRKIATGKKLDEIPESLDKEELKHIPKDSPNFEPDCITNGDVLPVLIKEIPGNEMISHLESDEETAMPILNKSTVIGSLKDMRNSENTTEARPKSLFDLSTLKSVESPQFSQTSIHKIANTEMAVNELDEELESKIMPTLDQSANILKSTRYSEIQGSLVPKSATKLVPVVPLKPMESANSSKASINETPILETPIRSGTKRSTPRRLAFHYEETKNSSAFENSLELTPTGPTSYDITSYEELRINDEDEQDYRDEKHIPEWAKEDESRSASLAMMISFTKHAGALGPFIFPRIDSELQLVAVDNSSSSGSDYNDSYSSSDCSEKNSFQFSLSDSLS